MDVFPNTRHRLEILLAVVLIGLSLAHVAQLAVAMATTSLSTDEFGTVGSYSSKGPASVLKEYRSPKNHVFFNLLNSLLPARDSLEPGRVRSLSILATILTALVLVAYAGWRRRWMEGAIVVALWSSSAQVVELSMEARGYGFLGLFAVLATVAVLEYLHGRRSAWLWILGMAAALGTYTVPGFLFFAGPLLLLLWLSDRSRITFFAGFLTLVAILLLYSPLLGQVYAAFTSFHQDKAEADFVTVHGWIRAVQLYLFQGDDRTSWILLAALAFFPFVPQTDRREGLALRIIAGASIIDFLALHVLRTPPLRMAAFCLLPLSIAGFWAMGSLVRSHLPSVARVAIGACAGALLLLDLVRATQPFHFVPTEDWLLAARAIDTAFPKSMPIDYLRYAKYLRQTLPDAEKRSAAYDPAAFAAGRLVVADASNKWAEGSRFVPPPDTPRIVRWIIPGTIRDVALNLCVPPISGLTAPPSLVDGRPDTGWKLSGGELELQSDISADARSLIVLFNRPAKTNELKIAQSGSSASPLIAGNAIVFPLGSRARHVDIHLGVEKGSNLTAIEAWIAQ